MGVSGQPKSVASLVWHAGTAARADRHLEAMLRFRHRTYYHDGIRLRTTSAEIRQRQLKANVRQAGSGKPDTLAGLAANALRLWYLGYPMKAPSRG